MKWLCVFAVQQKGKEGMFVLVQTGPEPDPSFGIDWISTLVLLGIIWPTPNW